MPECRSFKKYTRKQAKTNTDVKMSSTITSKKKKK